MKTKLNFLNSFILIIISSITSGCYTQLAIINDDSYTHDRPVVITEIIEVPVPAPSPEPYWFPHPYPQPSPPPPPPAPPTYYPPPMTNNPVVESPKVETTRNSGYQRSGNTDNESRPRSGGASRNGR